MFIVVPPANTGGKALTGSNTGDFGNFLASSAAVPGFGANQIISAHFLLGALSL